MITKTMDCWDPGLFYDGIVLPFMGSNLGIHIPFLPKVPGAGPGMAPKPIKPPPQPRGDKKREEPKPEPTPDAGDGGGAPAEEKKGPEAAELPPEAAPKKKPVKFEEQIKPDFIGNDMLGGKHKDVPMELHAEMVMLAQRGDIAATTPVVRMQNINKRPTFYGPPEWKEAVKYGYLHPKHSAPRGYKWKDLKVGWKLRQEFRR